jgi:hypothetical protein
MGHLIRRVGRDHRALRQAAMHCIQIATIFFTLEKRLIPDTSGIGFGTTSRNPQPLGCHLLCLSKLLKLPKHLRLRRSKNTSSENYSLAIMGSASVSDDKSQIRTLPKSAKAFLKQKYVLYLFPSGELTPRRWRVRRQGEWSGTRLRGFGPQPGTRVGAEENFLFGFAVTL